MEEGKSRKEALFLTSPNDIVMGQFGLLAMYDTLIRCYSIRS